MLASSTAGFWSVEPLNNPGSQDSSPSAHVVPAGASAGTRKLEGGRSEQGVSSTSATDPTPASTMFLATCGRQDDRGSGVSREQ